MSTLSDSVDDSESLYRRVQCDQGHYTIEHGTAKVSSTAFGDRHLRPSVDRASLCGSQPSYAQLAATDAVLVLVAAQVREVRVPVANTPGSGDYVLDVVPRPLSDNPAHAQVEPAPDYATKSRFRKVQEKLARIAQWAIKPVELRT